MATFPGVEVISLGGATEATVWSNYYPIKEVHPRWLSIPYGKPIQNVQYYILDSQLNPCPIGIPGNLYIGGECLSSGYVNAPVLTAEKFIPNPFSGESDCLYHTGDLARYLPDGNIEFLGRLDHQVKLRGFRIELSEIDTVLGQHPAVRETLVLDREDVAGEKRLVAYVVPETEKAPTTSELHRFLKEKLPEYMVPSAFVMLETLPLNANGKVDRRALPAPLPERPTLEGAFVATRNAVEFQLTQIWEQVLSIQPIGIRDNFFELGGNSLLALRLFAEIETIFGKKLPLATLLQAPTVEQLTCVLRDEGAGAPWRSLVAVQPKGDKPPFFCVHALGGNVLSYYKLANYLGKEQPFYGLQARGLDGKQTPHSRIEEMAADYIKEIQTLQPQGPYFLGGHSFGGLVAYEMAQQLHTQGQKVALLVLSDTVTPKLYMGNTPPLKYQLSIHRLNLSQLKLKDQLIYILERMRWSSERLLKQTIDKFNWWRGCPSVAENPYQLIEEFNRHALINYQPQVYPGRVVLIRAIERSTSSYYEPLLGWGELAALGVEVIEVPGHHATMISEPRVRVLAARLRNRLNQAQADN
jgi:thioesterase domain-containing protein/acyl carrier protein